MITRVEDPLLAECPTSPGEGHGLSRTETSEMGIADQQRGVTDLRISATTWAFTVRPLGLEPRTCGLRVGAMLSDPVSRRRSSSRSGSSSGR
jgi:hypothetical protein